MTGEHQAERLFFQTHEVIRIDHRKSFYQKNDSDRTRFYLPIAQLVEWRTVLKEDVLRSLVRFRVGAVFHFGVEGKIGCRKTRKTQE